MALVQDPYIRERLADFEDLTNRLLQHLDGGQRPGTVELPDNAIIVARQLGPAELLDYDRSKLRGVVLEEGSVVSHVSIVARALDIPVVGRIQGAMTRIEPMDRLVVDGENSVCFVRPGEEFQRAFVESMALHEARLAAYARDRDLPSVTADGTRVDLHINAGLLIDVPHLDATGAAGIGLYRTEVPFMYQKYAGLHGWRIELIDASETDIGGFNQVIASINGADVFAKMKYESGVHRVQRVPVTESGGRIHTSAATVAVLPEAEEVDVEIDEKDLRVDTYRSQGAGGQHGFTGV